MSSNKPGKPYRKIDEAGADTTEGHGRRGVPGDESVNRDIDSTEGHAIRAGKVEDADTEGHPFKRVTEAAGDDQDTQGHPLRK